MANATSNLIIGALCFMFVLSVALMIFGLAVLGLIALWSWVF